MNKKYKVLSDIMKRYKDNFSDNGAHSNFASATMNAQISKEEDKIDISFFDNIQPFFLKIKFLTVADITYGFCEAIVKQRVNENMLPLKGGAVVLVEGFRRRNEQLQKKLNEERNLAQRKT